MSELLVPLGYLRKCDPHSDIFLHGGGGDPKEIFEELTDEDVATFDSPESAVSAIRAAFDDAPSKCPDCDRHEDD